MAPPSPESAKGSGALDGGGRSSNWSDGPSTASSARLGHGEIGGIRGTSLGHRANEEIEQIARVMRSWRGFRVVLHAENRLFEVSEPRHGPVIEVSVRDFGTGGKQAVFIDTESMILTGDLHPIGQEVANRLIGASMPEFQFPGRGTQRQGQKLVAQADSEGRNRSCDASKGVDRAFDRRRVPGTIGDEQAVDAGFEDLFRGYRQRKEAKLKEKQKEEEALAAAAAAAAAAQKAKEADRET